RRAARRRGTRGGRDRAGQGHHLHSSRATPRAARRGAPAHRARALGALARRRGSVEPRDRGGARALGAHRQEPPRAARTQARHGRPRRPRRGHPAARPSARSRCAAASSDAPCARPGTARGTNYGRGMHADPTDEVDEPADDAPRIVPLTEPAGGIPPVTDTPDALARVVTELAGGSGPVAADAERASGYRYGQRTYLVQLRREGAPTALVDPVALPDLSGLSAALDGVEFVLHAASQDLPGFRE